MLKLLMKRLILSVSFLRTFYFSNYVYRRGLDEKIIRGKLQNLGHCIELSLAKGIQVPTELLRELEFLIKQLPKRGLSADEASEWAFQWFIMGKYNIKEKPRQPIVVADSIAESYLSDAICQRRSVRQWTKEPIERKAIEKLIEVAKWTPSSCNRQTWQVLMLDTKNDFDFISKYFPNTFYLNSQLLLVVLSDASLYSNNEKHFAYLDTGAFIQNLLLLLHAEGFGACWIGFKGWDCSGAVFSSSAHKTDFYDYFGLKKDIVPVSMLAIGHSAARPKAPPRQALDNIIIPHNSK